MHEDDVSRGNTFGDMAKLAKMAEDACLLLDIPVVNAMVPPGLEYMLWAPVILALAQKVEVLEEALHKLTRE